MAKRGGAVEADKALAILEAADALFCERGYAGVGMRDVAARAGVNKGLIFYYYKTKSELFAAVLARYYEAHAAALAPALDAGQDFRARVHALLDAYLDFMQRNRRYARLIQQEVARAGEQVPLIRKNLTSLFLATAQALADHLPERGPLAPKHFFLSLSGITINYFTYAPALRTVWGEPPLGEAAQAERRAHVHWVADALLDRLEREPPARP